MLTKPISQTWNFNNSYIELPTKLFMNQLPISVKNPQIIYFNMALAKELGPKSIRVNAVCPVLVATDGLIDALNSPHSPAKDNTIKFLDDFAATQSALGRLPTVAEVGDVCVFLASDKASAITGQCINVDCGVFPQ